MALANSGAFGEHLTPRPNKTTFQDNFLSIGGSGLGFTKQFLPEVYEKEIERYGNRTISGFLSQVGAELPMASDEVVWSEQGRLHVAYDDAVVADASANTLTLPSDHLIKVGDTIVVSKGYATEKCYVSGVSGVTVTAKPYAVADLSGIGADAATGVKVFVYGSEYAKKSATAGASIDAPFTKFTNKPIILRDKYSISGSDTAQIGWVEVSTEDGAGGYLWYIKSQHEAKLRFQDQLEMAMVEAEKKESASGISASGISGSEGLFAAIESRGLVFNDQAFSSSTGLDEFDAILQELDKQGAIEENMIFGNRGVALGIDDMLAAQNSYGSGGTSYGVFNNSEDMALNLGFSGFRRGSYDFYKTDWKYLNDPTTRGLIADVEGVIAPAGVSTVYDQNLGKNISRPLLHVRYRKSAADDRRMKEWVTGSVGPNPNSEADEMNIHLLSERCLCVQGANNFVLLKATS